MDNSEVTVVIPTIPSRTPLLKRALRSVFNQSVLPTDVIVLMDKNRIGAARNRNRCLPMVQTEWIAWLDDDDEFFSNHLEECLKAAKFSGADLIYPWGQFVGSKDPLSVQIGGKWRSPFGVEWGKETEWHLRKMGNFIPVTYLVKTKVVCQVGGFPQPFTSEWPEGGTDNISVDCEDYGLLIRMLNAGATFYHTPVKTWRYYFHKNNTGGRGFNR